MRSVTSYSKCMKCSRSTLTQSFCYSFIALSIIHCSKSAQKFAVHVCQVATVAMETTQLVLSQFENFYCT